VIPGQRPPHPVQPRHRRRAAAAVRDPVVERAGPRRPGPPRSAPLRRAGRRTWPTAGP